MSIYGSNVRYRIVNIIETTRRNLRSSFRQAKYEGLYTIIGKSAFTKGKVVVAFYKL